MPRSDGQGTLDPVILMFECPVPVSDLVPACLSLLPLHPAFIPSTVAWSCKVLCISPPCQAIMPLLLLTAVSPPHSAACFSVSTSSPGVPVSDSLCGAGGRVGA